jgi:tetratricopeptide (TPR) repeat protein
MPDDLTHLLSRADSTVMSLRVGPGGSELLPKVGRYAIEGEIARGGMGVILRATDTVLGREVAVKVLHHRFDPASDASRRFADEARITAQLQHPAIPPVHDLGTLPDGRPFLAMKLIKGHTLNVLLAARPDPSHDRGRFVAVFEQVCQALAYAHAHGVIHRDLKPGNVMVGAFGEVQVMDWGLAKVLGERVIGPATEPNGPGRLTEVRSLRDSDGPLTQAGSVLGTPAFMPPEQAAGALARVDVRSDVFGLGAILAVILTGKPPFAAASPESSRQRAAHGEVGECFARLDGCGADPDLVALCKRCLAPDPAQRPCDGGEVAAAVAGLRQAAEERARRAELERVRIEGEKAAAEVRAAEQRKRRRVQLALLATVLLLLLGGGGFAWWQAEQGRVRRARTAEAVSALLKQCEEALQAGDAAKAAVALKTADERADEGGAEELADRLQRCRADLAVLSDLDAIDQSRWTLVQGKISGWMEDTERCRQALRRFGADPAEVPPEEVAARVSASSVRERLVTALDRLLLSEQTAEGRAAVGAALRAADPDPYRDAFRAAWRAGNLAAIKELAGRPAALEQPAGFTAFLGEIDAVGIARRRELLTAGVRRWPRNLGLLMALGETYETDQKQGAEERVRWFQAAVGVAPDNAAAHNSLGGALADRGELDAAIAEYQEALRLDPRLANAHNGLGIALRKKGNLNAAIAEYQKAIRLDPRRAYPHNNLGLALVERGALDAAIGEFEEALRLEPRHADAHNNLGNALRARGDLDGAIAEFKEALRLNPRLAYAHTNLGNALRARGDLDRALAEFQKALELDPGNANTHNSLGVALRDRGDLNGAIAEFRKALGLDPRHAYTHRNLGIVLREKGDLDGAITAYREALPLDPRLADVHNDLGNVLRSRGDLDEAIAVYREAIRVDPRLATSHHNLGLALAENGDLDGALAAYKEALRLEPRDGRAHNNLGLVLRSKGNLDGAIVEFREALRLEPGLARAHNNLGLALRVKGDLDGAVAEFKEVLRLDPKYARAEANLAQAEWMRTRFARLPDVLAGRAEPKTPSETCEFAYLCAQPFLKRYAAAVRLYQKAFAADAKVADDLRAGHRFGAACCAVQAASGQGRDAPRETPAPSTLRRHALEWLKTELAAWTKRLEKAKAADRQTVQNTMRYWQRTADLSGVRHPWSLLRLPADERRAWQKLWADVAALVDRAAGG